MSGRSLMNPGPSANAVRRIRGHGAIFTIQALRDQVAPPTLSLSVPTPPDPAAAKRTRHLET
jgi:hypothetical protein